MDRALREFRIRGVATNLAFLEALHRPPAVPRGEYIAAAELGVGDASLEEGMLVATPRIRNSRSARSMPADRRSGVGAQAVTFTSSES